MTSCSCSLLPMKAFIYIFDCAGSSVAACRDLIPWQGIEPRSPALGAWSLNHRTTKEVPYKSCFLQLLGTFLSVNLHATWFMNHWIKPVRSLRFAQLNSILWSKLSCDLNYLEMFVNLSKVTRPWRAAPGACAPTHQGNCLAGSNVFITGNKRVDVPCLWEARDQGGETDM